MVLGLDWVVYGKLSDIYFFSVLNVLLSFLSYFSSWVEYFFVKNVLIYFCLFVYFVVVVVFYLIIGFDLNGFFKLKKIFKMFFFCLNDKFFIICFKIIEIMIVWKIFLIFM